MSLLKSMRKWDVFPKTAEDYVVQTKSGALISILASTIILFLFFSELSAYLTTGVDHKLSVDVSRNQKLRINVDVTFPHMACAFLSLDAMDISGSHQLDVVHNIYKKRVDQNTLEPIPDEVEKETKLGGPTVTGETRAANYCGSCYGAEDHEGQCCNTCDSVREQYRKKGWSFENHANMQQCVEEGFSEKIKKQQGEGCNIYGYLEVNKVAGNFHFAPGKSFQQHHMHVHDLLPFQVKSFNLTHIINKLSFGEDFPGVVNPLDGTVKPQEGEGGMFQYFIKIVPTTYRRLSGRTINTNQFSVTEHFRPLNRQSGHGLPGVFFMFDLSPIMVAYQEKSQSLGHFLTGVCAIIGGVYTVAQMIDSATYATMRTMKKKIELGKHS